MGTPSHSDCFLRIFDPMRVIARMIIQSENFKQIFQLFVSVKILIFFLAWHENPAAKKYACMTNVI